MSNQRTSLSLDIDEPDIDLTELTEVASPAPTTKQQQAIFKAGEFHGFVNRDPRMKKPRKRSPYVLQKNIKLRIGMSELLSDVTSKIKLTSDQETIERALLALIEQEGLTKLKEKFEELIK